MILEEIYKLVNNFSQWYLSLTTQSWFTPTVSALTLPILAWTAWEALKSSRATSDANNLKLLPLIGIYFLTQGDRGELFQIKNLGEGVAYDITIDHWMLILQDTQEIIEFRMTVPGTNILSKGEEKNIVTDIFINGQKTHISTDMRHAMMKGFGSEIQLHFKDATGRKCASLIKLSEEQVNIKKPTYRIGLLSTINIWYGMRIQRTFKLYREKVLWKFEEKSLGTLPSHKRRIFNIIKKRIVTLLPIKA